MSYPDNWKRKMWNQWNIRLLVPMFTVMLASIYLQLRGYREAARELSYGTNALNVASMCFCLYYLVRSRKRRERWDSQRNQILASADFSWEEKADAMRGICQEMETYLNSDRP